MRYSIFFSSVGARAFTATLRLALPTALSALVAVSCAAKVAGISRPGGDGGTSTGGQNTGGNTSNGSTTSSSSASSDIDAGVSPVAALTTFATIVRTSPIDKVDVLFDIDNSASMADKQGYLAQAIPDLIGRLINPNCIDSSGAVIEPSVDGTCSSGQIEFAPVHDLHLGVVSSSLGSRLSEPTGGVCDPAGMAPAPFQNLSAHYDDQGHLLNRTLTFSPDGSSATEGTVANAVPGNYLDWFPGSSSSGPVASEPSVGGENMPGTLVGDSMTLVNGVGTFGCGIESQLESWYRFLVQPDPYASLQVSSPGSVTSEQMWVGVDTTVLQQRKDFLRPDSAVAIVVLTDENDSEIDVRSLTGQGYFFMRTGFEPPRGTSACLANPADPACVSCSTLPNSSDPSCQQGPYRLPNDWGYDMNLRHVHMKAKYGLDPQYPIARYTNGLTSPVVPDRFGEYTNGDGTPTSNYLGRNDCTNPLFAAGPLPDGSTPTPAALCNLPVGTRTPDLVFYAVIGGVPNELLHFQPGNALGSQLSNADWTRILGTDPSNYQYDGIDPHMIEDYRDRTTVSYPFAVDTSATNPLSSSSTAPQTPDPVNGREWVTDQEAVPNTHVLRVDRQYACTFALPTPRDCTLEQNAENCDCPSTPNGLTPQETPPVCNGTTQIGAKAYPTTRELLVAKNLGPQGIVGSICPIHPVDLMGGSDPLYGYRPTVSILGDHLRNVLATACLPQALPPAGDGSVTCTMLVQLPPTAGGTCINPACDSTQGLTVPSPAILSQYCSLQEAAYVRVGSTGVVDPATQSVCQLTQLVDATTPSTPGVIHNPSDFDANGTCPESADPGWCYVAGMAAAPCSQEIRFANGSPPAGAVAAIACQINTMR